ncbi:uncharacterized [Tachysurus ichikawai]
MFPKKIKSFHWYECLCWCESNSHVFLLNHGTRHCNKKRRRKMTDRPRRPRYPSPAFPKSHTDTEQDSKFSAHSQASG